MYVFVPLSLLVVVTIVRAFARYDEQQPGQEASPLERWERILRKASPYTTLLAMLLLISAAMTSVLNSDSRGVVTDALVAIGIMTLTTLDHFLSRIVRRDRRRES